MTGLPLDLPPNYRATLEKRFWSKVEKTEGCWIWKATKLSDGYGQIRTKIGIMRSHRVAYELIKGKIPEGLTLDHLCRNPSCVNPDHLEPVTNRENTMRGNGATAKNARKTLCPRGHPLIGDNLLPSVKNGQRRCLTCDRKRHREYRQNNRESLLAHMREYYQKNRDWINTKRRAKYARENGV